MADPECQICMCNTGVQLPCCNFTMCSDCTLRLINEQNTYICTRTQHYRGIDPKKLRSEFKWFICPHCTYTHPLVLDALCTHVLKPPKDEAIVDPKIGVKIIERFAQEAMYTLTESPSHIQTPRGKECEDTIIKVLKSNSSSKLTYIGRTRILPDIPRPTYKGSIIKETDVVFTVNWDRKDVHCAGCKRNYIPQFILRSDVSEPPEGTYCDWLETPITHICQPCLERRPELLQVFRTQVAMLHKLSEYYKKTACRIERNDRIVSKRNLARMVLCRIVEYIYTWIRGHHARYNPKDTTHRSHVLNLVQFQLFLNKFCRE